MRIVFRLNNTYIISQYDIYVNICIATHLLYHLAYKTKTAEAVFEDYRCEIISDTLSSTFEA